MNDFQIQRRVTIIYNITTGVPKQAGEDSQNLGFCTREVFNLPIIIPHRNLNMPPAYLTICSHSSNRWRIADPTVLGDKTLREKT